MSKAIIFILGFLLNFTFTQVKAGWYECYNYKGNVGNSIVSFSIQVREGYFGEIDKKDFNITGVYKYEKYNNPIRLEGRINFKSKEGLLYELNNSNKTAIFKFNLSDSIIKGTWQNISTKKSYPFQLKLVSTLIDTSINNTAYNVPVLQAASLPDLYFVGLYSKDAEAYKAQMSELQIYKKADNSLFQVIDFSKIETSTGNVSTLIIDNLQIINSEKKEITVTNNIGRTGGYLVIKFSGKKRKFILNTTPVIEGPN